MAEARGVPASVSGPVEPARGALSGPAAMVEIQRTRMLNAMVKVCGERGAANVTVADVTRGAGISRRTFYEVFEDCQDCLSAAIEQALARVSTPVIAVYEAAEGGWSQRIRAGLFEILATFEEQPEIARLLVVEWLAAGPRALERRQRMLARLAEAVDAGRDVRSSVTVGAPGLVAEAVVGGVVSVLHARLVEPEARGRLIELTNPLMSSIVLPYLGAAAARKELERPLPSAAAEHERGPDRSVEANPLQGSNLRLTYRTMSVIAAVAGNPGASNRAIAQAAGIADQGQISKLLTRLRKQGLLENNGGRRVARGDPNAWSLTAKGERFERSLRA